MRCGTLVACTSLPLFPLRMLPLPGEFVELHIFEPRYQRLFNELENMELVEFRGSLAPTRDKSDTPALSCAL